MRGSDVLSKCPVISVWYQVPGIHFNLPARFLARVKTKIEKKIYNMHAFNVYKHPHNNNKNNHNTNSLMVIHIPI